VRSDPRRPRPPIARLLVAVIAAALAFGVGGAWSGAAAAPALKWTFNSGLQGWSSGRSGAPGSSDWGKVSIERQGSNGYVRLDGNGDPANPNAWIFRTIQLPKTAKTVKYDISADDVPGSDAGFEIAIESGGKTTILDKGNARNIVPNRLTFRTHSLDISEWAGKTVTLYFMQNDNGVNGVIHDPDFDEQLYYDNIEIVAPVPPCDIEGTVRDGNLASDRHDNPLVGVPVDLLHGTTPVTPPAVTDSAGHYCIKGGVVDPGDYTLRVALVDGEHNPPIFQTRYQESADPVSITQDISAADFGRKDLDLTFSATAERPWLADVANIHWQSGRFVDWVLDTLVMDPGALAGLVIDAGATVSTRYRHESTTVFIGASDTPYAQRQDAATDCPENCEWHEISHHVAAVAGIAVGAGPTCTGQVNHGGWSNDSTCDSLREGFATFLPTLASLDIDADRGTGYATPDYAGFTSLEDNGLRPWTRTASGTYREDIAVAELLWDLADDTPSETTVLGLSGPDPASVSFQGHDRVAIGGVTLVQLLFLWKPATVADIHDSLLSDPVMPAALKNADVDIDADGSPDLSPIDEVFVAHGFHATRPPQMDYAPGFLVGLTTPGSHSLLARRDEPAVPGSGVRLGNGSAASVTVSIDITYPSTSSHLEVVLGPGEDRVIHLELPPYWLDLGPADGSLPPCTTSDAWPVSMTISAPGTEAATISNCQYLHAIAAASGDTAVTYAIGIGLSTPAPAAEGPTASATRVPTSSASPGDVSAPDQGSATGPILLLAGLLLIVLVMVGIGLRRRRRA
jgi:hypothetical protein